MNRRYYTLLTRARLPGELTPWAPQFGGYDRQTVVDEREDMLDSGHGDLLKCDTLIITTGAAQADIDAAVAKLNGAA